MPTVNQIGAITGVIGSEVIVGAEKTENKHYAAHVSIGKILLADNDAVELRLYIRVDEPGGDSEEVKDMGAWDGNTVTESKVIYVPWEPPGTKWVLKLKQISGIPKTFKYRIYEAA